MTANDDTAVVKFTLWVDELRRCPKVESTW